MASYVDRFTHSGTSGCVNMHRGNILLYQSISIGSSSRFRFKFQAPYLVTVPCSVPPFCYTLKPTIKAPPPNVVHNNIP